MKTQEDQAASTGFAPFLTYEPFYGLKEKPFSLSSDPKFLYRSAGHVAAFDRLNAGIRRREGLVVLSGEIGTGKTTLCRAVLAQLDRKTFSTFVPDPFVTREDLLKMLLLGFGVVSVADLNGGRMQGASRQDLSYPLYEFLDSLVPLQAFAVLVIDEAQNLSLGVMEEIRILAELERREKLLQVVLVGQPELRDNLRQPQMRQVEQRVTVRCELAPLGVRDVAEYVKHRLTVAAERAGGVEFSESGIDAVQAASGGVPRLINLICDRALERGYETRSRAIGRDIVERAVRDLGLSERSALAVVPDDSQALTLPFEDLGVRESGTASARGLSAAEPGDGRPVARELAPPRPGPEPSRAPDPAMLLGETTVQAETRLLIDTTPARGDGQGALDEFASEPETANLRDYPQPVRVEAAAPGGLWMLFKGLAVATAALGIAVGAGVLDTRAAVDTLIPTALPGLPMAPDRMAAAAVNALTAPDPLVAALTDARAHEPDTYTIQVVALRDRPVAERLVTELTTEGYRARWAEVQIGGTDDAIQQVFVDGYGTLEDAMGAVSRLRRRASSTAASLTRPPGAGRRPITRTR